MFDSISITGFRGFSNFRISNLGRINLIVGKNNCGKTSILEAINVLASRGDLDVIVSDLTRRGEFAYLDPRIPERDELYVDVSHIFNGHHLTSGMSLSISSDDSMIRLKVGVDSEPRLFKDSDDDSYYLIAETSESETAWRARLIEGVGIRYRRHASRLREPNPKKSLPGVFVATDSLSVETTSELWVPIALTRLEDLVLEALRSVDDRIEKIAFAYPQRMRFSVSNRGGFRVKLRGVEDPVPIGSLGDGVWRIIALSIAAVSAKGGVLLVDEIDTGLHFTVLDGLWRTLLKLSKALDIQVFATTHSRDCVERLATICHPDVNVHSDVTIQRIETGSELAVAYTEHEIMVAAERGFEMR